MNTKPLIDIFVNKHFEVEPFMAALMALSSHYNAMPFPTKINIPTTGTNRMETPRASYRNENLQIDFDVWCIEDLMDKDKSGSNSEEKYSVLPALIGKEKPKFIISVSSAESTLIIQEDENRSVNGSVLFGNTYSMFDVHSMGDKDPDPQSGSYLTVLPYIESNVSDLIFEMINGTVSKNAVPKFRMQLNSPAPKMRCVGSSMYTSIGVVNVTNYKAYPIADKAACEAFTGGHQVCIETTHGIVSMAVKKAFPSKTPPVLFASPITDRYLHFEEDVGGSGIQNYIAGYNAGIAVGELLVEINQNLSLIQ